MPKAKRTRSRLCRDHRGRFVKKPRPFAEFMLPSSITVPYLSSPYHPAIEDGFGTDNLRPGDYPLIYA